MSRIFGEIRQLGYVVEDIQAAMKHWTDVIGVGPFFYAESIPIEDYFYHGQSYAPQNSVALANSGPLQIELIQLRNDVPSMYRDFWQSGQRGLQHVAYWTSTFDEDLKRAERSGLKAVMGGQVGQDGRFVYFDTEFHPGTVVELSEVAGPKGRLFDAIRAASENWDGADPVRSFPDLASL